jgi:hypothetical protein
VLLNARALSPHAFAGSEPPKSPSYSRENAWPSRERSCIVAQQRRPYAPPRHRLPQDADGNAPVSAPSGPLLAPRAAAPQSKGVGSALGGLAGGLGSTVTSLGRGLGKTLDCTVGVLLGSCARRGKTARGPSLGAGVAGLTAGLGGTVSGVAKGLGGTVDGTLGPLLSGGGRRRGKGKGSGGKGGLAGSVEGLVGCMGQTVTALGQGLAQTAEGTLAPVLGPAAGGIVGGGKGKGVRGGKAKGKGKGAGAGGDVAILARRRAAPAPQNGGLLGGLLGGLVGGLGEVVSGLGSGLGSTLDGTLSPLVGGGGAPVVVVAGKQRKEPAAVLSGSERRGGEGGRRRMGPSTVLTTRDAVRCRKYPDTVQASPSMQPLYPLATALQVVCAATPSLPGNSGRVDGDDFWLRTREGCYVNRAEVRVRHDSERDFDTQLAVPRCEEKPRRWVGMLQSQYSRADCYDCPSLDCPSKNVGEPPFVDLQCYEMGENVRDDRLVCCVLFSMMSADCLRQPLVQEQGLWLLLPGRRVQSKRLAW